MKLSIVIPTYNTERYLKDLLPLLSRQLVKDTEVLIVDDGSTDNTTNLVSEYLSDNLKYLKIKNGGVSNARNTGIENTTGEYIAFIDSDDLIADNYINKLLDMCNKDYDYFNISWKAIGSQSNLVIVKNQEKFADWNSSVWSRCYKRTTIGNNKFNIALSNGEDKEFNDKVLNNDKLIYSAISEPIYIYRVGREDSLCSLKNAQKTGLIIWQSIIQRIGGIETFVYNLVKKLSSNYDIMILYNTIHPQQFERLSKLVKCEKYNSNKKYSCDVCVSASAWGGYPDSVVSTKNEYWQFIHGDFKAINFKYNKWNKTTRHFAVSKAVQKSFKDWTGYNSTVLYNLLDDLQKTKPILKLITMTRLTREKGYDRMLKLAQMLKDNNVKFRWTVFTNPEDYGKKPINMEEFIFMKSRYDIWDYIKEANYVVQLSDTEGWCYSINEGLQYGIPAIATNFDSVTETIKDGYNGYILNMDLSNVDINKIVNKIPKKFKYEPLGTMQDWENLLGEHKKLYDYIPNNTVKIKIIKDYYDIELKTKIKAEQERETTRERAEVLINSNVAETI